MEPIEKIITGLMIATLATVIVMEARDICRKIEERRPDNYAMTRIIECEHQISLLRERVERLEESR